MVFDFFTLAVFQNKSKKFWRLTENPENIFRACEKFTEIFSGKIFTRTHPQNRIISGYPKNQSKPKFSDVNLIAGCQGHLQPEFSKNPAIINAKKTMPLKAR